ncbi:MAG: putative Ig domain-containing protein [Firmicutes bacterium]|nr:putative Ig domain-containing protein [Bacillota bacterium]
MRKDTGFVAIACLIFTGLAIILSGGFKVDSASGSTPVIIQGVVLAPTGAKFRNEPDSKVEVKICPPDSKEAVAAGIPVNENGYFELSQVIPDGDYLVYAEAKGSKNPYLDSKPLMVHIKAGSRLQIELTLTAPLVKGWVYKPDQTVFGSEYESNVWVYLTPVDSAAVLAGGIVQDDGSFKLGSELEAGDYLLYAEARGSNNRYADSAPLKVRLEPGKLMLANLFLTAPLIQGMVLKPNGTPYTKTPGVAARVWLQPLKDSEKGAAIVYQDIGENGSYKFGNLDPGDYLLGASLQGGVQTAADSIPVKVHITAGHLLIQNIILTVPSITGRVFTPGNRLYIPGPESGVEIALLAGGSDGKEVTRSSLRKDGAYSLGGNIPAGDYTILARVQGKENPYTDALPVNIKMRAGQRLVADLWLTNPLVKGRVLTPGGTLFLDKPDCWVSVQLAKPGPNTNLLTTVATSGLDKEGSFKFGGPIPAGEYQLTAEAKGSANPYTGSKPVKVYINPGQIAAMDLVLNNPALQGRVLKPDGSPASSGPGQEISIRLEPFGTGGDQTDIFPVNQDGSYRVGNISGGQYKVWAQVEGQKSPYYDSEPVLVRLNGEKAVNQDLTLTQPLITGTIKTPDGNLFISGPDSGVEVVLKTADAVGREIIRVKAYPNGAYRLGGKIPTGDYRLYALVWGASNPYLDAEPLRVHITTGLVIEQEIQLKNPVICGQVLTPKGSPFLPKEGATVEVFLKPYGPGIGAVKDGVGAAVLSWKAAVSKNGAFKVGGDFKEGDYILEALARGNDNPYADAIPIPVHLKTGEIVKQDISLVLPTVTGTLLDPNGVRLTTFLPGEVYLYVQNINSNGDLIDYGRIPVNSNGSFNLGLPKGNYFVRAVVETVRIPYTDSVPAPVYVEAGKAVKLDTRLTRPVISGRLLTPDDRPFIPENEKWARVHLKAASSGTELIVKDVGPDGTYKLGGAIPAGAYLLEAEAGGLNNKFTDAVPVMIQVAAGKSAVQNLTLTNPLVSGRVLAPDDTALTLDGETWSNVYLTTLNNPNPVAKKPVNSDGSFRLGGGIPAGYYVLHAEAGGTGCRYADAAPVNVQLESGKTLAINIRLTNPALMGRVLLANDEVFIPGPESWVTVSLKTSDPPNREAASALVNLDGTYRLGGGIFTGDYLIFVTAGGSANPYNDAAPVPVRLEAGRLATKDLYLGPLNSPPVFARTGNKSVNEGELLQFVIKAHDPDGQPLTYSFMNLPLGASYNSTTNSFNWVPYYFQAGTYKIQALVSDGKLTDRQIITITVNDVTPVSLIRKLTKQIEATDLPATDRKGLLVKLDLAMQSLGKKDAKAAIDQVNRLMDALVELRDRKDSKLAPEKAGGLIKMAENIIYVIQL